MDRNIHTVLDIFCPTVFIMGLYHLIDMKIPLQHVRYEVSYFRREKKGMMRSKTYPTSVN